MTDNTDENGASVPEAADDSDAAFGRRLQLAEEQASEFSDSEDLNTEFGQAGWDSTPTGSIPRVGDPAPRHRGEGPAAD